MTKLIDKILVNLAIKAEEYYFVSLIGILVGSHKSQIAKWTDSQWDEFLKVLLPAIDDVEKDLNYFLLKEKIFCQCFFETKNPRFNMWDQLTQEAKVEIFYRTLRSGNLVIKNNILDLINLKEVYNHDRNFDKLNLKETIAKQFLYCRGHSRKSQLKLWDKVKNIDLPLDSEILEKKLNYKSILHANTHIINAHEIFTDVKIYKKNVRMNLHDATLWHAFTLALDSALYNSYAYGLQGENLTTVDDVMENYKPHKIVKENVNYYLTQKSSKAITTENKMLWLKMMIDESVGQTVENITVKRSKI